MPYYPNPAHTILYLIAALVDGPKTVDELCRLLVVNKKTVHKHLHTLHGLGMVVRREGPHSQRWDRRTGAEVKARRTASYEWSYDPCKAPIKLPCELQVERGRPMPANPPQTREHNA